MINERTNEIHRKHNTNYSMLYATTLLEQIRLKKGSSPVKTNIIRFSEKMF